MFFLPIIKVIEPNYLLDAFCLFPKKSLILKYLFNSTKNKKHTGRCREVKNTKEKISPSNQEKYYKHNFFAFVWHGVFLYVANAFTQITTVQTSLIFILTGSSFLSGVLLSAHRLGSVVPQLFFVNWVQRSAVKKPFLIAAVLIRGTAMLVMAGVLYFSADASSTFSLVVIFLILLTFFLAGGMGDISYFAVFSKTIDPGKRGKNFGYRYFLGGILGLGAGYLTKQILSNEQNFPLNYALLYFLAGIALYVAWAGFASLKELPGEVKKEKTTWYGHFRLLKDNPNFIKFIWVEILLSASGIVLPLYVIYAKAELHLSLSLVGAFVTAQIVGDIVSGPFWGRLGDKRNFRLVLFLIGLISGLTPLAALFIPMIHPNLYIIVFLLIGMTYKGLSLGISNYLLEIAPKSEVPSYVAVKNIMQLPSIVYPLLGGLAVNYLPYGYVFVFVSLVLFVGTALSAGLYCGKSKFKERLSLWQIMD